MPKTALRKAVIPVGVDIDVHQLALVGAPSDRPPQIGELLVQQTVEEALASGLDEVIFVVRDGLLLAEERAARISATSGNGDQEADDSGDGLQPRHILISRQEGRRGLGHAIWSTRAMIGEEPFAVMVPGRRLKHGAAMSKLIARYEAQEGNVVGIVDNGLLESAGIFAAITKAAIGRYILQPGIFDALEKQGEWDLNTAVLAMAEVWPLHAVALPQVAVREGRKRAQTNKTAEADGGRHSAARLVASGKH